MEEGINALKMLRGKPRGKGPLGKPKFRWEKNIRLNLKEIGVSARN